jgi:acyl transferase domain-containing protein
MVPDIEFHSGYFAGPYDLSPDRVATALTEQLLAPQDLPTAAWRAWDSGVRIFIEHGPRNLLTCALRRILPRDQGLFLAMDVQGENSLHSAMRVAAELWCRGVPVDLARLETALGRSQAPPAPPPPLLDVAASLFAASLASAGSMRDAYQACLRNTEGRFLEFLDPTSGQNAPHA